MTFAFKEPKCKKKFDGQKEVKQFPIPIELFDKVLNLNKLIKCYLNFLII
jgi:hypothetical protein